MRNAECRQRDGVVGVFPYPVLLPRSATGGANGLNRRSGIAHTGNSRALRSHRSYCRSRSASYLLASRPAAAHRCFQTSTGAARRLEMPPVGSYACGDPRCQLDLSRIPPPRLVWGKETLSGRDELRLLRLPARRKLRRLGSKLCKLALNISRQKQGPVTRLAATSFA